MKNRGKEGEQNREEETPYLHPNDRVDEEQHHNEQSYIGKGLQNRTKDLKVRKCLVMVEGGQRSRLNKPTNID